MTIEAAVGELVGDGDTVAMEGFTHLIPLGAGHEIIRQGRRDLTLARLTPDLLFDQMIGMGCADQLIFSWGGNPGRRFPAPFSGRRRAGLACCLSTLEEHSHAGLTARYVAGASGLPFGVLRGYSGTGLAGRIRPPSPLSPARSPAKSWPPCRRSIRMSASSTPSRLTGRATSRSGESPASRRRPFWRRPALGDGGGDRRPLSSSRAGRSHPSVMGDQRRRPPAGWGPPVLHGGVLDRATTTSTRLGTPSAATGPVRPTG